MGMKEDLKIPLTMLSLSFLNKLPYIGSYNGKRFKFEKNSDSTITVYVWDDKFNFENTDKELMTIKEFDCSNDGINKGIEFVESLV